MAGLCTVSYIKYGEKKKNRRGIIGAGGECPPEITYVLCGLCLIVSYLLEGRGYRHFLRRDLARYAKPVFVGRSFATKFSLSLKFLLEHAHMCRGDFLLPHHGQNAHGNLQNLHGLI